MAYTTQTFLEKFKQYAINDMKQSGILASLTAAQALIESNRGNSGLTTKANNLFGIKGSYNKQSVSMLTTEYYNGVKTRVYQNFRKYPSWQESVNDHSAMFNRMARYENLRNCQDYEEACTNVKKDGYATAPDYAQTLIKSVKNNKLWMWDYEVLKNYAPVKLRTVKKGSDGGGVYLLQTLLKAKGYKLGLDGQFGGETDYIVRNYQEKNGLVVDGIVGQKTWSKLKA
jgi:flagellum-specific peptidoglycan hydrolase FlgJ